MVICQLLLSNSRLSYRELAHKLNLSVTAVHTRIRSMVELGVIRRFSAKVSIAALKAINVLIFGVSEVALLRGLNEKLEEHGSIYWLAIGGGSFLYIGAYLKSIGELEPLVNYVKQVAGILDPTVGITSSPTPSDAYGSTETTLHELDYQIIRSLKDDSRKATSDIAEELGVSAKTVRRRLNRMMQLGLVDLSIEWYPDASNDIMTVFHFHTSSAVGKNKVGSITQKYWPNVIFYWGLSNVPNFYLAFVWTNTMKELKSLHEKFEHEPGILSVSPNILYTGYIFQTWIDRIVQK
jgi:DNA-binding Lrp family transcriptional regulator